MDTRQDNSGKCRYSQKELFEKLIWDIEDICNFTGYAKGTIYNKLHRGEIPYRRGHKHKVFFIPSEVISWLKGE
jgi:predicted DNA-binding transcriptional regulator AlpA